MKQVLLIDASPLFRDFLTKKLSDEKVSVEAAFGNRDGFVKFVSILPDLVVIEVADDSFNLTELEDFFEKKMKNPNTNKTPIIMAGPKIEREQIAVLAQYGVIKYFTKPIKFDIFFESVGRILRTAISMDTTPCVLEVHINNNIIFVEVAQGLNREKMALLKFKVSEIISQNSLKNPKVVLMMSDLTLSFVDGTNLEFLLDALVTNKQINPKNIKILSLDEFTREMVDGHAEYSQIEVSSNLSDVMNSLVEPDMDTSSVTDLIADKILASDEKEDSGFVETRFSSDTGVQKKESDEGTVLKVAVIDDDMVSLNMLQTAFALVSAKCLPFSSGSDFLKSIETQRFDLVILDIFMPGISGFDILKQLREKGFKTPILIYSQAIQKESVVTALKLGARSYLVKPQNPAIIAQKGIDLIRAAQQQQQA